MIVFVIVLVFAFQKRGGSGLNKWNGAYTSNICENGATDSYLFTSIFMNDAPRLDKNHTEIVFQKVGNVYNKVGLKLPNKMHLWRETWERYQQKTWPILLESFVFEFDALVKFEVWRTSPTDFWHIPVFPRPPGSFKYKHDFDLFVNRDCLAGRSLVIRFEESSDSWFPDPSDN